MNKKKGITGHDDLDAKIDAILEKAGGSIRPGTSEWRKVSAHMDRADKRDAMAKEAKQPATPNTPSKKNKK